MKDLWWGRQGLGLLCRKHFFDIDHKSCRTPWSAFLNSCYPETIEPVWQAFTQPHRYQRPIICSESYLQTSQSMGKEVFDPMSTNYSPGKFADALMATCITPLLKTSGTNVQQNLFILLNPCTTSLTVTSFSIQAEHNCFYHVFSRRFERPSSL